MGPRAHVEDGFLALGGLRFHYRDWGDRDAPPIVLLHGGTLWSRSYDRIAEGLSSTHRVLLMDQRGHGETDWAGDYRWPRWVEDVERFVDALGIDPFDLVGHSMGGAVAGRFAGTHPHRVRHLVLLDAWYSDIEISPDWRDFWSNAARLYPDDGFASTEAYVDAFMSVFPRADRDAVEASTDMLVRDESGAFRRPPNVDPENTWDSHPTVEEENRLRKAVACPVLVAQAEHSEMHLRDDSERVAAIYPNGEAAVLEGAGHNLAYEKPASTVDLIRRFVTPS